jgi:uncharacterized protein DUF4154
VAILGIRGGRAALLVACVLGLACLPATSGAVAARATREYDLKAAFLFNFARFVEWPADAFATDTTPITIGILGDDPFGRSLDDIVSNEAVRNRRLIVRRYSSVDEVESCHILFISASQAGRLDQILGRLGKRSVLTVGDTNGFTSRAGMVGFEMARSRLKLQINLSAVRAARLTISSQLLRQARIVESGTVR